MEQKGEVVHGMFWGELRKGEKVLYCIEDAKEAGKTDRAHIDAPMGRQGAGKKG